MFKRLVNWVNGERTKEEISKARQLLDPDQVALFEIQEEWLEREEMGVQASSYSKEAMS